MHNQAETRNGMRWIRADLHIHTPASEDYAEPGVTYLEILQEAERRELELIAFTDHNTVHGYEQFQRELEFLRALETAGRLTADEQVRLTEYRRLQSKIMVLPGFEFTSHFGSHILGIFPPNKPLSLLEATLLQLGVPPEVLKQGLCGVANTRHVTDAYEIITRAGGMVIAPHVNGPNGIITETLRMGTSGQSRIAATQSQHLHALEFVNFYTDHEKFTSPGFYNGKIEHYERRMFCIQGSDAHRLRRLAEADAQTWHRHGIGDRYIELMLPDNSFDSLKALFASQDFDRVRVPKRDQKQWAVDALRAGQTSERQMLRTIANDDPTSAAKLWIDVAALANSGGGVLVVGCDVQGKVSRVTRPDQVSEALRNGVSDQLTPLPYLTFELMSYEGQDILRVEVKVSEPPPYVGKNGAIYVRRDGETALADRGEILQLCRRALAEGASSPLDNGQDLDLPRSGVQVVSGQRRAGAWLYEVRDLRTTAGVTRERAQGLWAYAISRHEDMRDGRVDLDSQVKWKGRLGLWRAYRQGNRTKYDLVHRDANGVIDNIFYGVSDWGLSEGWMALLSERSGEPVEQDGPAFDRDDDSPGPPNLLDEPMLPSLHEQPANGAWGERRVRWRGRGGLSAVVLDQEGQPTFDLVMKDKDGGGQQEYTGVSAEKITDAWLSLVRVARPRTGIEVVSASVGDDSEWQYVFRNLRTGDVSGVPWRLQDIEPGTVREYAARMYQQDAPLDEEKVRWWGNIGYMRPMRSQVDLIYIDERGEQHFYYAARREELNGEWRELLELYGEM